MKLLPVVAKTKYGVVKFPPKMAATAKRNAAFMVLEYVYNYSTVAELKKLVLQIGKVRGFTLDQSKKKFDENFWKIRSFRVAYDFTGLPESYFKPNNNKWKELFLKNSKGEYMEFYLDFTKEGPRNLDWEDSEGNFGGYFTDRGNMTNSGVVVDSGSIVIFTDGFRTKIKQIENTLKMYMESNKQDSDMYQEKKGKPEVNQQELEDYNTHAIKSIKSKIVSAKLQIETALEHLDETVEHELRHMVQYRLLPQEQQTMYKGYDLVNKIPGKGKPGEGEGDYYISPVEFGPIIQSVIKRFAIDYVAWLKECKLWDIKFDGKPYVAETKFEKITGESIVKDITAFTGKIPWKKSAVNTDTLLYWQQDPAPEFITIKKRKPTAYAKAIKIAEKILIPALVGEFNRLAKQKTVQTRRKKGDL